jgi:hypothetical protein
LLDFQNTWKSALEPKVHDRRIALCPDNTADKTGSANSCYPEEPCHDSRFQERVFHFPDDAYAGFVQIPKVGKLTLDVITDTPNIGELARYIRIDIPFVSKIVLYPFEYIPKVGKFFRHRGVDTPQVDKFPADCVLLRGAPIPSYEKIVAHQGDEPTVNMTLPVSADAAAAAAVTVLLNQILRTAAAATSPSAIAVTRDRGVVNDNPIGAVSSSTTLCVPVESYAIATVVPTEVVS